VGDLYNINITDRNNYMERREYLERGYTINLINYFKYCDETGNCPFNHMKTGSTHVLNPVKAMIDGVYEWALIVRIKKPQNIFISDSTIRRNLIVVGNLVSFYRCMPSL
jgi:hypothetical protein